MALLKTKRVFKTGQSSKNFIYNNILGKPMVNVFCEKCNYKYDHKDSKPIPKKCPYCDAHGTIKEVKKAQDWLDDVSSIED